MGNFCLEDGSMTPTRSQIETLVVRIQQVFLSGHAVRLTLNQIARRVDASAKVCQAVLRLLVDARVLAETRGGTYERFFPQAARASRSAA
jgi:hypothetical protein